MLAIRSHLVQSYFFGRWGNRDLKSLSDCDGAKNRNLSPMVPIVMSFILYPSENENFQPALAKWMSLKIIWKLKFFNRVILVMAGKG